MKILFDKTKIAGQQDAYIVTEGEYITYVGNEKPSGKFDRTIDTKNKLVIPGLYNCHTHAAMQLFRGYGEDMPLDDWLNKKIFPAEERLTGKSVYTASLFAIAEMIKNGIVSFSDMYYFCESTVKAVAESGIKANISRSLVSFDPYCDFSSDTRYKEAIDLAKRYHNTSNGRIKTDMSLHAEYTNVEGMCRTCADFAKENGLGIHIHLSETEKEHNECIARHGKTPAEFFLDTGVFDVPAAAAHCVWVTDGDIDIMKEHGVTAVHNPASNLKLGSGVMRLSYMLEKGLNVALGTDSSASNNTLDILKEMYLASILQKGIERDPSLCRADEILRLATLNGAKCQNRADCGELKPGKKADIVMLDMDEINNIPSYDPIYTLVYSASSSNVCFNMVDGSILYENGQYSTLDIEKIKYDMKNTVSGYFS